MDASVEPFPGGRAVIVCHVEVYLVVGVAVGAHEHAAIGAVERHLYSDDLNIATIADELSMSKSTLNNKLVQACGLSTREFIEDIRLRHSVKFLREGRRVSEVSDMLGFSSAKYFTIRFKRKYGVAPSVYLKDSAS